MTEQQYLDTWTRDRRAGKLSALQKLQLAMAQQPSLIGTQDPANLAICVDTSHWNGKLDVAKLKAGGVALIFPKASDGKQVRAGSPYDYSNYVDDQVDNTIQQCYDNQEACIPYHYVQPFFPGYTISSIVDTNWKAIKAGLKNKIPGKSFQGYMLDVEEKTASPSVGSTVVLELMKLLAEDEQTKSVPVIVYTSMNILNYYVPLREQLSYPGADKNLFMAQWIWTQAMTTTWEILKATIFPKLSMKVLTPGYANWKFLQWSAVFTLPGCSGGLDLDFYNGTREGLYKWLNFQQVETPPPPPPPNTPPDTSGLQAQINALTARVETLETTGKNAVTDVAITVKRG